MYPGWAAFPRAPPRAADGTVDAGRPACQRRRTWRTVGTHSCLRRYWLKVDWCWSGSRVTGIHSRRWAEIEAPLWDFKGHIGWQAIGGVGTSRAYRWTQGKFPLCARSRAACRHGCRGSRSTSTATATTSPTRAEDRMRMRIGLRQTLMAVGIVVGVLVCVLIVVLILSVRSTTRRHRSSPARSAGPRGRARRLRTDRTRTSGGGRVLGYRERRGDAHRRTAVRGRARRTKIVCTIGPGERVPGGRSTRSSRPGWTAPGSTSPTGRTRSTRLARDAVRDAQERAGRPLALIADLQGPKLRLGDLAAPRVLETGRGGAVVRGGRGRRRRASGQPGRAVRTCCEPGDDILIDDGLVRLRVEAVRGRRRCRATVVVGGVGRARRRA